MACADSRRTDSGNGRGGHSGAILSGAGAGAGRSLMSVVLLVLTVSTITSCVTAEANETVPLDTDTAKVALDDSETMAPVETVSIVPDVSVDSNNNSEETTTLGPQTNTDAAISSPDASMNDTTTDIDPDTDDNVDEKNPTPLTTAMMPQSFMKTEASNQTDNSSSELVTTETPSDFFNGTTGPTSDHADFDMDQNATSETPRDTQSPTNATDLDDNSSSLIPVVSNNDTTTRAAPSSVTTDESSNPNVTQSDNTNATPPHMSQVDGLYPETQDADSDSTKMTVTTSSTKPIVTSPASPMAGKATQSTTTTTVTTPQVVTGKQDQTLATAVESNSTETADVTTATAPPPPPPSSSATAAPSTPSSPPSLAPSSLPLSTSSPPFLTTPKPTRKPMPTTEDIIMIEMVRLVFQGTYQGMEFANKVYDLLHGFLLRATREQSARDGTSWSYNMSSYMRPVTHTNTSTYIDFKIQHSAQTELTTIFQTLDLREFIDQNSNLTLIAECRPSANCQEGPLPAAVHRSTFESNAPVFISVIVICCLCVGVMIAGLLCTRFRRRGTWINNEDVETKVLSDNSNRSYLSAKQSPFTDAEITKGEKAVDDTSFNGNAEDGDDKEPGNNENTWVIPLGDALDVQKDVVVAKTTEDTRL